MGQSITFTTDSVNVSGFANDYEIIANCYIENLSGSTKTIVWKRIVNDIPAGWTSSVCDKNACWGYGIDSKTFLLPSNKSEKLDVYFYPNNSVGNGRVEMIAFVEGDSANTVVKAVFKGTAQQPTGVATNKKPQFNITTYPNPIKDYLMIKGLPDNQTFKIDIYSILGSKVANYTLAAGAAQGGIHEIDMQELPKGVYMIRVMDKNMNLIFNKSVSKMK